jgi:5-methylcytosine-specific restriction endonuclease McrA
MTAEDDWRARYEQRIRSAQWKNMKRDMIRLRGAQCERCGCGGALELHHKDYQNLGRELISDLELVCHGCHLIADEERAAEGRERSAAALEAARYDAGLDTYATKKYGEEWDYCRDPDEVAREFDDWLERKSYDE